MELMEWMGGDSKALVLLRQDQRGMSHWPDGLASPMVLLQQTSMHVCMTGIMGASLNEYCGTSACVRFGQLLLNKVLD